MNESTKLDFSVFKPYYQQEFTKITESNGMYRGKFNLCACLLTWIWFFTKGMMKEGVETFAIAAICVIVFFFTCSNGWGDKAVVICGIVVIITDIIVGAKGNYIYYKNIMKRMIDRGESK